MKVEGTSLGELSHLSAKVAGWAPVGSHDLKTLRRTSI